MLKNTVCRQLTRVWDTVSCQNQLSYRAVLMLFKLEFRDHVLKEIVHPKMKIYHLITLMLLQTSTTFFHGTQKEKLAEWQSLSPLIFVASFHTMKVNGDYYHPFFVERNHAVLKGGELMRTVFILGVNFSTKVSQCVCCCFGLLNNFL